LSIARKEADWQRAEARVRREDGARICAERDAAQARVAELEADIAALREHSWGDLPGYGACDPLTRRIHDADAALGALVRRMQRRVIVERLRDGTYSVGLRGEPRVYFRDEERTFAWAADAALGEE